MPRAVGTEALAAIDWALLQCILLKIACSEPWAYQLRRTIQADPRLYHRRRDHQAHALLRSALYPPGGSSSPMPFCDRCEKHTPLVSQRAICWRCFHQCTEPRRLPEGARAGICQLCRERSGTIQTHAICLDCYYCCMPDHISAHVPSSPSAGRRVKRGEIADGGLIVKRPRLRVEKESPVTPSNAA